MPGPQIPPSQSGSSHLYPTHSEGLKEKPSLPQSDSESDQKPSTIDGTKNLPQTERQTSNEEHTPPVPDEARALLNMTQSGRQVSQKETDHKEKKDITSSATKALDERDITPEEAPTQSRFAFLNPVNWFRSKSTQERKVSQSEKPGFVDSQIFRLIRYFASSFVKGLEVHELTSALSTLSKAYHKAQSGQSSPPEVIKLKSLVLADSGIPLQDVEVKLHTVQAAGSGTGADKFKSLKIRAEVTGKASIKTDDETTQEGEITIPDVEIDVTFEKGDILQKLMESGNISSNLGSFFWKLTSLKDYIFPAQCSCKVKGASIQTRVLGEKDTRTSFQLNSVGLHFDRFPPPDENGKVSSYQVKVSDLDTHIHGSRLERVLPKSLRGVVSRILPYASFGETDLKVQASSMELNSQNGSTRLSCPELKLQTQGDLGLKNGVITGLTVASKATSRTVGPDAVTPHAEEPIKVKDSSIAVNFKHLSGDVSVPQASLQLPYDIKGPVELENGTLYINRTTAEGYRDSLLNVNFNMPHAEIDLRGGLTTTARVKSISGSFDGHKNTTKIHIGSVHADQFELGSAPDRVSDQNLLIKGHGKIHGIQLEAEPDHDNKTMKTRIRASAIHVQDIDGKQPLRKAKISNAQLDYNPLPPDPQPDADITQKKPVKTMGAHVSMRAQKVYALDVPISEKITGQNIQADVYPVELHNCHLDCELGSAPSTDKEKSQYGQHLTRPVEDWQRPKTKLVFANIEASAGKMQTEADLTFHTTGSTKLKPKSISSAEISVDMPQMSCSYDADQGLEHVTATAKTSKLDINRGQLQGHIESKGTALTVWNGTEESPNEISTTIAMTSLEGKDISVDELLPEAVKVKTEFKLTRPVIKNSIQPPQKLPDDGTGAAKSTSRPVQTKITVDNSQLKTTVEVSPSPEDMTKASETLKTLEGYLPEEQKKQFAPILSHLKKTSHSTPQATPLKQDIDLETEKVNVEANLTQRGTIEASTKTQKAQVILPSGPLTGKVHLDNMEIKATSEAGQLTTELFTDTVAIDTIETAPDNPLPVTFKLNKEATIHGIHAHLSTSGDNLQAHASLTDGDLDFDLGLTGTITETSPIAGEAPITRPLQPMQVKTSFQNANFDIQREPEQTITATTLGHAELHLKNTKDQLGAQLNLDAEIDNVLVATDSSTPEGGSPTTNLTVELESAGLKVNGDLNGSAAVGKGGLSVSSGPDGIRINPRFDSRSIKLDFPNPAQELISIFTSDALKRSAIGQICDIKVHPELDKDLNGRFSMTAGGALSPLIGLALTYVNKPVLRGLLHVARVLTTTLNFRIHIRNLPLRQGKTTLKELVGSLHISFTSQLIPHSLFAKMFDLAVWLLEGKIAGSVMRSMHLLNEDTGEIAFTNLASHIQSNLKITTSAEMPIVQLPGTGDPLTDIRNQLQIGHTLPSHWNEVLYEKAVYARLKSMRWNNKPLKEQKWASKQDMRKLSATLCKDFPLPQTINDFRNVENLLGALKTELRNTEHPTLLEDLYQNANKALLTTSSTSDLEAPQSSKAQPLQVKVLPASRLEQQHKKLDPAHVAKTLNRIKETLSKLAEHPNGDAESAKNSLTRLTTSKAWRTAHSLIKKAEQQSTHLPDEDLQLLWKASMAINRKVKAIMTQLYEASPMGMPNIRINPLG